MADAPLHEQEDDPFGPGREVRGAGSQRVGLGGGACCLLGGEAGKGEVSEAAGGVLEEGSAAGRVGHGILLSRCDRGSVNVAEVDRCEEDLDEQGPGLLGVARRLGQEPQGDPPFRVAGASAQDEPIGVIDPVTVVARAPLAEAGGPWPATARGRTGGSSERGPGGRRCSSCERRRPCSDRRSQTLRTGRAGRFGRRGRRRFCAVLACSKP